MISEKFSTNTESFNEFRRGRRIDWRFPVEVSHYRRITCCTAKIRSFLGKDVHCSVLAKSTMKISKQLVRWHNLTYKFISEAKMLLLF